MASLSYWFLSPTTILALWGKLKGFDRTQSTPAFDWRSASVDVVIPARNEEATVALCLRSLFEQDFPVRKITLIDDGSTDRTAEVVERFCGLSDKKLELIVRERAAGKTPIVREQCSHSDADVLLVLDADTVLSNSNYISRLVEELFKNAGVASACGEVTPLTCRRRKSIVTADETLRAISGEFASRSERPMLEAVTVVYRSALYLLLQRFLYDGHLKLFGSRLNPIGCAVAYRRRRLQECFDYARPLMGDDLSNSEDIFIGHFFSWKGYRNVQVPGVRCESLEPPVNRLPRQLYLWSSSFLQCQYYFKDLPLSIFKRVNTLFSGPKRAPKDNRRRIREQYRAPWGEQFTRRHGRPLGLVDLFSLFEKVSYPLILILLAIFRPRFAVLTIAFETLFCTVVVFVLADARSRWKFAGMTVAATPVRLLSLGVDLWAVSKHLLDLVTGNRKWRK